MATIIDGKKESELLLSSLKNKVEAIRQKHNLTPGLAICIVGDNPASKIYVNNKIRSAEKLGYKTKLFEFPENTPQKVLVAKIEALNNDMQIHGIIVQLPLPKHIDKFAIIDTIKPAKDVDGFTNHNVGMLHSDRDCLKPCTPSGIMLLLNKHFGGDLMGKKAVVIGRSLIVGKPMAAMLLASDCSVTHLHSKSKDLEAECKKADIIVTAVGKENIITANMVSDGACIIDVGIQRKGDRIIGDADFMSLTKTNCAITPVPGGVGPMTVACLLENTMIAACKQKQINYNDL